MEQPESHLVLGVRKSREWMDELFEKKRAAELLWPCPDDEKDDERDSNTPDSTLSPVRYRGGTPPPFPPPPPLVNSFPRVPFSAPELPNPQPGVTACVQAVSMVATCVGLEVYGAWRLPSQEGVLTSFPVEVKGAPVEARLSQCPYTRVLQEWVYIDHYTAHEASYRVPGAQFSVRLSEGRRLFPGATSHRLLRMHLRYFDGDDEVATVTLSPCERDVRLKLFSMAARPGTNQMRLLVYYPKSKPGARRQKGLPAGILQRTVDVTFCSQHAWASLLFVDMVTQEPVITYARAL